MKLCRMENASKVEVSTGQRPQTYVGPSGLNAKKVPSCVKKLWLFNKILNMNTILPSVLIIFINYLKFYNFFVLSQCDGA